MAINPSFTTSQVIGQPENVVLTDTSSGSFGAITQRRVYLYINNGGTIVPQGTNTPYVQWALANQSITIDCLDKDYAINIEVQWLDNTDTVINTVTNKVGLTMYNETFDYQLTQMETANSKLANNNNFFSNKSNLRTYIDSGNQAMIFAADIYAAQLCYDRATDLRLNAQYTFS